MKRIVLFLFLAIAAVSYAALSEDAVRSHLDMASEYFEKTDYSAAAAEYEMAKEKDAASGVEVDCKLGYCYYKMDRLDEAEDILTAARETVASKQTNGYHCTSSYLGYVYSAQGRHDEAIALHTELTELFPNYWHVWYSMGKTFVLAGKYNEAKRPLDMSYTIHEDFAHTPYYQGLAYYNLNDFHKSVIFFGRATAKDPAFADAYYYRGMGFLKMELFDEALPELEKAAELEPKNKVYRSALKDCRKTMKLSAKKQEAPRK